MPRVLAQGRCCVEVLPGLSSIFNLIEEKERVSISQSVQRMAKPKMV